MEYDNKLEEMEEELQKIINEKLTLKFQLESKLTEAQKSICQLIKKNEALLMWKQKEMLVMSQKKIEWKKDVDIIKRSVSCLNKDKSELRYKLEQKTARVELKKCSHQGVQAKDNEARVRESLELEVSKLKEKNYHLQQYASEVNNELNKMTAKALTTSKKSLELSEILNAKEEELQATKQKLLAAQLENEELKRRREASINEIKHLTHKISSSKKVDRCSQRLEVGKREKLILAVRNELEVIYKGFISCVFHDPEEDAREVQELAGKVDLKINKLLEQLIDYCEDFLEPNKQSPLIVKKRENKLKSDLVLLTPIKLISDSTTIKIEEHLHADDIVLFSSCEVPKNALFGKDHMRRGTLSQNTSSVITEFNCV
eukprot:TRINITY_DN11244_c0_g1_i8.p1 TRINITY_DN11244_c0_g1~~TRINITY_DN11244_c0_g1_i8.p1  ORF type:complete len:373 (+),score=97.30 TRINITY_DN11244_c0_g1_i8:479-1597(+)